MNTDKTTLTAEQYFMQQHGGKHPDDSVNHGETFTAIAMTIFASGFSSQQNKELIEERDRWKKTHQFRYDEFCRVMQENNKLRTKIEELEKERDIWKDSYNEKLKTVGNLSGQLQESQQLNERLVEALKSVQAAVNIAPDEWLMTMELMSAMLNVDELLSSTKEKGGEG